MNKKKLILIVVCVLFVAATVGVGLYVRAQQQAKEVVVGITLTVNGKSNVVLLSKLNQGAFEGETVNGKGDRSTHAYRGIELKQLLSAQGVDGSKVTAVKAMSADQYVAEITGDEMREEKRVYVVVEMDGKTVPGIDEGTNGAQLVVFGDENSKRNVRYLSIIEISAN